MRAGVVVVGRNEGERLVRCLESAAAPSRCIVYVDSGSTDESVQEARRRGAEVVELDLSVPFTAARARNAGIQRLEAAAPGVDCVQVIDGDCEMVDGWLDNAVSVLESRPDVAVVCGRRRERHPEASVYNRLCDMEWNTTIGETTACGGDALLRLEALQQVGGYRDSLIAGEEPEMCLRLRQSGWKVVRIDADMTWHDADLTRFGQWWMRNVRAGHAYAEGMALHGRAPVRYRVREVGSIIGWVVIPPLLAIGLAWVTKGLSLVVLALYLLLFYRVRRHRRRHGDSAGQASLYAAYCVLGKLPQLQGVLKYWMSAGRGGRRTLIEYKDVPAGPGSGGQATVRS